MSNLNYVSFNFECLIWKSNPIGYLSTPAASVAYFKSMQSKPSFFGSQLSNESVKGSENFPPSIFCRQRPRSLLFWFGYCATISTLGSKYICSLVWLHNFHIMVVKVFIQKRSNTWSGLIKNKTLSDLPQRILWHKDQKSLELYYECLK